MSLKILIDMNLSPDWVEVLRSRGWECVHWLSIGDPRARDEEIMEWAKERDHVVLTHDLDFGTMLALTHASSPSVIQVRTEDTLPDELEPILSAALLSYQEDLENGALLVVDREKLRVRILPF